MSGKRSLIYGVGINDWEDSCSFTNNKGKKELTKEYKLWRAMITRCYSDYTKSVRPTYIGVTCDDTWLSMTKFIEDVSTLKGYNNINEVLKYKGKNVYVNDSDIKLDNNKYLDEELIGLNVIYEDNNKGTIIDIERYDKTVLFNIKNNDKEYLIPYNDNIIDKIDINNKRIYIKDIKGLFD